MAVGRGELPPLRAGRREQPAAATAVAACMLTHSHTEAGATFATGPGLRRS